VRLVAPLGLDRKGCVARGEPDAYRAKSQRLPNPADTMPMRADTAATRPGEDDVLLP
jgi:hypothetical protein